MNVSKSISSNAGRWLTAAAALLASACGPPPPVDPEIRAANIETLTGNVERGKAIFEGDVIYPPCWSCHGKQGLGGGHFPNLRHAAVDFTTTQLALQIMKGGEMPSFASKLTDQQIADVIAHVRAAFGS